MEGEVRNEEIAQNAWSIEALRNLTTGKGALSHKNERSPIAIKNQNLKEAITSQRSEAHRNAYESK